MGGTSITFRFNIGQRDLDDLIVSKRLDKEGSLQEGLFAAQDMAELKHPEYYATDRDTTWSTSRSDVRMTTIWPQRISEGMTATSRQQFLQAHSH